MPSRFSMSSIVPPLVSGIQRMANMIWQTIITAKKPGVGAGALDHRRKAHEMSIHMNQWTEATERLPLGTHGVREDF